MKLFAVQFALAVGGAHALKAGEVFDDNSFGEAVMRQLKVMPSAHCRCPEDYVPRDGTCVKALSHSPAELCPLGKVIDGLCLYPASPALECPDEYLTACKKIDRSDSPCCAKMVKAEKVERCREGSESHLDGCQRVVVHPATLDCPDGFSLDRVFNLRAGRPQCIKEEVGHVSASCAPPDVLSPEGDSCLKEISLIHHECPEGYDCISVHSNDLFSKFGGPLCSACARVESETPTCGCPDGQEESDGYCYDASTFYECQSRRGLPMKQAPPTKHRPPGKVKTAAEGRPPINCKPIGKVPCICSPSFSLSCNGDHCMCIKQETVPLKPVCKGRLDENNTCLVQVETSVNFKCEEGFTCEQVDKTGLCKCVRYSSAEPSIRCESGRQEGDLCYDVIGEPKIQECPPGYEETCCDGSCSCTRTQLVPRLLKCAPGSVSVNEQCVFVSKPSPGCYQGALRDEQCIQEFMTPPLCG